MVELRPTFFYLLFMGFCCLYMSHLALWSRLCFTKGKNHQNQQTWGDGLSDPAGWTQSISWQAVSTKPVGAWRVVCTVTKDHLINWSHKNSHPERPGSRPPHFSRSSWIRDNTRHALGFELLHKQEEKRIFGMTEWPVPPFICLRWPDSLLGRIQRFHRIISITYGEGNGGASGKWFARLYSVTKQGSPPRLSDTRAHPSPTPWGGRSDTGCDPEV